ncbi:MT-A70 family methyltransferase [Cypionkella sp.]|uniref:MT-A70 family methyltransferase n=1 Tax=Cypionkella sp. TaxID=2811411 RepID=UPI002612EEBB|nr:MT-A70 family methyltransferase [Cypionkella sp.]
MADMFGHIGPVAVPRPVSADLISPFRDLRPAGGFDLIMADFPWQYEMRSDLGYEKSPQAYYKTMSIDEGKAMPVELLAARDCLLWFWAVGPMLPQALELIDAWGFTFKTSGHWVKQTKNARQTFGTGYILRNAGEPFLIATRGAPKTTRSVRNTIFGLARQHSRKPEECFREAEKLMPNAQRCELFSRQQRAGWTCWGNEAEKFGGDP